MVGIGKFFSRVFAKSQNENLVPESASDDALVKKFEDAQKPKFPNEIFYKILSELPEGDRCRRTTGIPWKP